MSQEAENNLVNIQYSIRFKEMLMARDQNSRDLILTACISWIQAQLQTDTDKLTSDIFQWLQEARSSNSHLNKQPLQDSPMWGNLHYNLSRSLAFQKLVNFFDKGLLPSCDLR